MTIRKVRRPPGGSPRKTPEENGGRMTHEEMAEILEGVAQDPEVLERLIRANEEVSRERLDALSVTAWPRVHCSPTNTEAQSPSPVWRVRAIA